MKRILMLAMLLMLALGAQSALAAPFVFGPSVFDDQTGLKENLEKLITGDTDLFEFVMPTTGLTDRHIKLVAVSQTAINLNFGLYDASDNLLAGAGDADSAWATEFLGDMSDFVVKWNGGSKSLADSLGIVYTYGDDPIAYSPLRGLEGIYLDGGTILFGMSLTGGPGVDFVLAISDASFQPVPVPAAVWLFGTGLAGIAALRRRANQA